MTSDTGSCQPSTWWKKALKGGIFLLILLDACQPMRKPPLEEVGPPRPTVIARDEFLKGKKAFQEGRWAEAVELLKRFLEQYPSTPWGEEALFMLGMGHFRLREYEDAVREFREFRSRFPRSPREWEVSFHLAKALLELGRRKEALEVAEGILPRAEEHPSQRLELLRLLAKGWREEAPLKALSFYYELWKAGQKEVRDEVLSLVDDLDADELREVAARWKGTFIGVYARLKLATLLLDEGKGDEAEALLREVEGMAKGLGFGELFESLWTRLLKPKERELKVGLLLPLSGRYAQAGREVMKGAFLAAGIFGDRHPSWRVRFFIADTSSTLKGAMRGYNRLKGEVQAIVGPLSPRGVKAVLDLRGEDDPCLFPLSSLEEGGGEGVWPLVIPVSTEVEELFLEARREGLKTFGLFYPRTPFGERVVRALQEAAWRWGGEVILYHPYREGEVDFGAFLSEMKEVGPVPDALMVAGTDYTLCLVASQLAYYDLQDVRLLGLRIVDPSKLLGLCRDYLGGAVITCPFWGDSSREEVRHFISAYREVYGEDPGYFAALGWDGVELLTLMGKKEGVEGLYLYGVTGLRAFSPDGTPIGSVFKLRIVHGHLEEIY
ncbi:MAG: hypothetical protein DRG33_02315 [Deltaproteobacteria bacterium]|nr:MAG: hypothetical protein DRG33_02315 [Deltaproteobacteria bacterium]